MIVFFFIISQLLLKIPQRLGSKNDKQLEPCYSDNDSYVAGRDPIMYVRPFWDILDSSSDEDPTWRSVERFISEGCIIKMN